MRERTLVLQFSQVFWSEGRHLGKRKTREQAAVRLVSGTSKYSIAGGNDRRYPLKPICLAPFVILTKREPRSIFDCSCRCTAIVGSAPGFVSIGP